jgi:tRNA-dihydrouridine synthase
MRKHVAWYVVGLPGATHCRRRVNGCRSYSELDELLAEYGAFVVGDSGGGGEAA